MQLAPTISCPLARLLACLLAHLPLAHVATPQQGPWGPMAGPTWGWEQALGPCGRLSSSCGTASGPKAVPPPMSLAGPMLSLEQSLKPPGTHARRSYGSPSPANAIHEHARAQLCVIAWSSFCACPCMPTLAFTCLGAHGCTLACRCRPMWVNAWLMLLAPLQLPCGSGGQ